MSFFKLTFWILICKVFWLKISTSGLLPRVWLMLLVMDVSLVRLLYLTHFLQTVLRLKKNYTQSSGFEVVKQYLKIRFLNKYHRINHSRIYFIKFPVCKNLDWYDFNLRFPKCVPCMFSINQMWHGKKFMGRKYAVKTPIRPRMAEPLSASELFEFD